MTSLVDVRTGLQRPRLLHLPPLMASTSGPEVVELAELAGLVLDPWQCYSLEVGCAEQPNGQWSSFENAVVVPRQNGKGGIIEARELAGLYLFREPLQLHTAHEFKTAQEAFRRILSLVENCDELRRKVARVRTSHGEEGIELLPQFGGCRLRFLARSNGSGRGFSGTTVYLDEAYALLAAAMAALLPTLSAQPNPQIWYFSSAAMATSTLLHALRRRAMSGDAGRLAYLEWSIDPAIDDPDDPEAWAKANPAMGLRISEEFIRSELDAMREGAMAEFLRERLGVPDDPDGGNDLISPAAWAGLLDEGSQCVWPAALALDVNPERTWASLVVAGARDDGLVHVEVVDRRQGVDWVPERAAQLQDSLGLMVTVAASSPAFALQDSLHSAGVSVDVVPAEQLSAWLGVLVDGVRGAGLRHIGQAPLDQAVRGAVVSARADVAWWSRRKSDVDISPLVAATLAYGIAHKMDSDPSMAVW